MESLRIILLVVALATSTAYAVRVFQLIVRERRREKPGVARLSGYYGKRSNNAEAVVPPRRKFSRAVKLFFSSWAIIVGLTIPFVLLVDHFVSDPLIVPSYPVSDALQSLFSNGPPTFLAILFVIPFLGIVLYMIILQVVAVGHGVRIDDKEAKIVSFGLAGKERVLARIDLSRPFEAQTGRYEGYHTSMDYSFPIECLLLRQGDVTMGIGSTLISKSTSDEPNLLKKTLYTSASPLHFLELFSEPFDVNEPFVRVWRKRSNKR